MTSIRSTNGSNHLLLIRPTNAIIEGLSRHNDEFVRNSKQVHAPLIREWMRTYSQTIKRQIEEHASRGCIKLATSESNKNPSSPEGYRHKVGRQQPPPSPSEVLPEDEIDRVNNLRVRDLQKGLKKENVEYKLKWNKKQLRDIYLDALVEKKLRDGSQQSSYMNKNHVELPTNTKDDSIFQSNQAIDKSDEINTKKVETGIESVQNDHHIDVIDLVNYQDNASDNEISGKVEASSATTSQNPSVDSNCEATRSDSMLRQKMIVDRVPKQSHTSIISISSSEKNKGTKKVSETTSDSSQSESRNNLVCEDATSNKFDHESCNQENKIIESRTSETPQPKLKLLEVKKGIVANVRAAYMEAVESKKTEFGNFKSPGPLSMKKKTRSPLKTLVQNGMQSAKRILSPGYLNAINSPEAKPTSNRPKVKESNERRDDDGKVNSVGSGLNMIHSVIDDTKSEDRMPSVEENQLPQEEMMEVDIESKNSPVNTNEEDSSSRDNEITKESKVMMEVDDEKAYSPSGEGITEAITVPCHTQQSMSVVNDVSPFIAAETKPINVQDLKYKFGYKEKTAPTTIDSSKNGNSVFKSAAAQASSDARKAIAEMRSKAAASKPPMSSTADISAKLMYQSQELEKLKKLNTSAQMRAKHLGLAQVAHSDFKSKSKFPHTPSSVQQIALPSKTVAKDALKIPHLLSNFPPLMQTVESRPEDNYEISDKEESDDDGDSDSEASESSKRKKLIPTWAQKGQLLPALENQFCQDAQHYVDPDELFGEVETCDLKEIFGSPRKGKYKRRASTGNWTNDRVTVAEKLAYRLEHKMRVTKQK